MIDSSNFGSIMKDCLSLKSLFCQNSTVDYFLEPANIMTYKSVLECLIIFHIVILLFCKILLLLKNDIR